MLQMVLANDEVFWHRISVLLLQIIFLMVIALHCIFLRVDVCEKEEELAELFGISSLFLQSQRAGEWNRICRSASSERY